MSKIKVGEYVRTNEGYLGKLIAINKQDYNYLVVDTSREVSNDQYPATYLYLKNENIKNHKEKLLELVEEGDYVNEYKVLEIADSIYPNSKRVLIYKNEKEKYERWIYIQEYDGKIHTQDDIVSIATKEQFENIKYKVGE